MTLLVRHYKPVLREMRRKRADDTETKPDEDTQIQTHLMTSLREWRSRYCLRGWEEISFSRKGR